MRNLLALVSVVLLVAACSKNEETTPSAGSVVAAPNAVVATTPSATTVVRSDSVVAATPSNTVTITPNGVVATSPSGTVVVNANGVDVPGVGRVVGDVAYGGNWFFLTHIDGATIGLEHARDLTRLTQAIQDALRAAGITGADGADIDHIELSAAPSRPDADSRNFVLCSGGEYDRSPCGTGTSAVMAARHRRGELALGEPWRQESVAGSLFTGWLTAGPGGTLVPHVRGTAFVTGEATLRFDPADPFRGGLGRA